MAGYDGYRKKQEAIPGLNRLLSRPDIEQPCAGCGKVQQFNSFTDLVECARPCLTVTQRNGTIHTGLTRRAKELDAEHELELELARRHGRERRRAKERTDGRLRRI